MGHEPYRRKENKEMMTTVELEDGQTEFLIHILDRLHSSEVGASNFSLTREESNSLIDVMDVLQNSVEMAELRF